MMSLEQIIQASQDEAMHAAREKRIPLTLCEHDNFERAIRGLPQLGTYLPPGWERVDITDEDVGVYEGDNEGFGAYFVDSTGFGEEGEPAITFEQFVGLLQAGRSYAIVEEGQFQVKIGVFRRNPSYHLNSPQARVN